MGKRRKARQMALQMLYQHEVGGSAAHQVIDHFDLSETIAELHRRKGNYAAGKKEAEEAFAYGSELFAGAVRNRKKIDELIRKQADNWRLVRMPAVDRNILRLAVYEMVFQRETPRLVVVDEAIELAKRFGSEQSGRFINGLLDGLLKNEDDVEVARAAVADPAG